MSERNCYTCVWHSEIGCSSWNCEELSRSEARKIIDNARWRDIEKEKPTDLTYVEVYVPFTESSFTDFIVSTELYVDYRPFTFAGETIKWWRPLPQKPDTEERRSTT